MGTEAFVLLARDYPTRYVWTTLAGCPIMGKVGPVGELADVPFERRGWRRTFKVIGLWGRTVGGAVPIILGLVGKLFPLVGYRKTRFGGPACRERPFKCYRRR